MTLLTIVIYVRKLNINKQKTKLIVFYETLTLHTHYRYCMRTLTRHSRINYMDQCITK